MTASRPIPQILLGAMTLLLLSGCFHPPYNNFKPYQPAWKRVATGLGVGTVAGAVAGNVPIGAAAGLAAGGAWAAYRGSKRVLLLELQQQNIQYVHYGDTHTLIVPTDQYFRVNTPVLNDVCYPGLMNIARLLSYYPNATVHVAGFTDNVGTREHKNKLSQAQAEAMLTFLWAQGVESRRLHAQGYGEKHAVGDNHLIHGSAYNRRIEIQWFDDVQTPNRPAPLRVSSK